jgi:hypothetical protein
MMQMAIIPLALGFKEMRRQNFPKYPYFKPFNEINIIKRV